MSTLLAPSLRIMTLHGWRDITSCTTTTVWNEITCTNHLNRIPKSFKTVILLFLVLFELNFLRNSRNLSGKRKGNKHVWYIFVLLSRVFSLTGSQQWSLISSKRESQHKMEIAINFSVYVYMSKKLQMESTTLRTLVMKYNQLAYKATMNFERQADFGRWWKLSCITMSLFILRYINFSCNVI